MTSTTRIGARETTPWYPADVKPVRPGVYEVLFRVIEDRLGGHALEQGFCYFGTVGWATTQSTVEEAIAKGVILGSQHKAWRGLREPAA
jgi:hypothetical protein